MGAWDPIFSDIDTTEEEHIYVVDNSGWGWFALFVFAALPFYIISLYLRSFAALVCEYPMVSASIYLAIALVLAILSLHRNKNAKYRSVGVFAIILLTLPTAIVQAIYAIPYVVTTDGFFFVTIEWILVTLLMLGLTLLIFFCSSLLQNGILQLLVVAIFLTVTILIVKPPAGVTWEYVKQLYRIEIWNLL